MIMTMRTCERCNTPFTWRESTSTLKMTYCGTLCERGDLGFTIEALLQSRTERVTTAMPHA